MQNKIVVTVSLEEPSDPTRAAVSTVQGPGSSYGKTVRNPRRFNAAHAALEGTFAESEMRRRSRIVPTGTATVRTLTGGTRLSVYSFVIYPATYGDRELAR